MACVFLAVNQPAQSAGPAPVYLGDAARFSILAGAAVTTTGSGIIQGDVGASPITGAAIHLTAAQVNGTIFTVDASGPAGSVIDSALLLSAKGALTTAYNDAAGRTPVPSGPFLNPGAGNIGGLTLIPGLYKFTGTASIVGADVVLNGGPDDVWIFQIAADLQVGSSRKVTLAGGDIRHHWDVRLVQRNHPGRPSHHHEYQQHHGRQGAGLFRRGYLQWRSRGDSHSRKSRFHQHHKIPRWSGDVGRAHNTLFPDHFADQHDDGGGKLENNWRRYSHQQPLDLYAQRRSGHGTEAFLSGICHNAVTGAKRGVTTFHPICAS